MINREELEKIWEKYYKEELGESLLFFSFFVIFGLVSCGLIYVWGFNMISLISGVFALALFIYGIRKRKYAKKQLKRLKQ